MSTQINFSFSDGSSNTSAEDLPNIAQEKLVARFSIMFVITLLLSVFTVFTNILILVAFYVEKKLQTYTNWYILNTTIADLVVGVGVMPLRSTIFLYDKWAFGRISSIVYIGFQNSALSVSVFGVIAICIDRYIATFYPIKHFQGKSIRKATFANVLTWVLSFGIWMSLSCVWDFLVPNYTVSSSGFRRANYTLTTTSVIMVSFVRAIGPFIVMTAFYFRIYFRVRHILKRPVRSGIVEGHKSHNGDTMRSVTNQDMNINQSIPSISLHVSSHSERTKKASTTLENIFPGNKENTREDLSETFDGNSLTTGYRSPSGIAASITYRESSSERLKAMRTLAFIILAFFISWLPNIVNLMIFAISLDLYRAINQVVNISEIFRWISFSNSLINPFAYAMAQPLIRKTVLKILRCQICCRPAQAP